MTKPNFALLVNDHSGSGKNNFQKVKKRLEASPCNVYALDIKQSYVELVRALHSRKIDTLIAYGGDGTVNLAATLSVELNIVMAIIPNGTFNHFAKDLHIPLEADLAVEVIVRNNTKKIDAGKVNDQLFVNNASLGIYPRAAKQKQILRRRFGRYLSLPLVLFRTLTNIDRMPMTLSYDDTSYALRLSSLFVGNNEYGFDEANATSRQHLDKGKLFIQVITTKRLRKILQVSLTSMGLRRRSKYEDRIMTDRLIVSSKKSSLLVAYDGETKQMTTPLVFTSMHKALTVIVP